MPEWRKPGTDAWMRYAIWGPLREDIRQGRADGWTWVRKKIGEEEQRAFRHPKTRDLFSDQDLTDMLLGVLQRRASTEADAAAVLEDVDALLRAGATADAKDEEGRTLLHWAAMRQSGPEVVKALVDAGAPPGAKDGNGRTALDHAEGRPESEMVAVLRDLVPAAVEVEELVPAAAQVSEPRVKPVETEPVPRPAVLPESESPEPPASEPRAAAPVATESPVSVLPAVEPEVKRAEEVSPELLRRRKQRRRLAVGGMAGVAVVAAVLLLRLGPGDVFRDCDVCPEMVVVPSGDFMMGSDDGWSPVHRVTIERSFAVGVYEVTFAEWDACLSDGGCGGYSPDDHGWGRETRPVIYASWEDAQRYVEWLSSETGEEYRLLSEAEWEYVARAGTETVYSWGDDVGVDLARCTRCTRRWDSHLLTAAVGSYAPNGFGLYDVHGNVLEWVEDCRHDSYVGAPTDGSAWTGSGDCGYRVVRGGGWADPPRVLTAAYRRSFRENDREFHYGFRVARTLD